jgi:tRNA pseudouridine13 synthase
MRGPDLTAKGKTDLERADLSLAPYKDFDYPSQTRFLRLGMWAPAQETFFVEELPLYPFSNTGEHAALVVEKAGITTRDLAVGVARQLGVPGAAVGYAGMKDKACVAVQSFTVARVDEARARRAFDEYGCRVLRVTRHKNKLRLGHLAGNRFRTVVAGVDPESARSVLAALAVAGVANYYGPQRFGARGDNAVQGLALLQGRVRANRWKRDLLVSALQSFVFNEMVARRVERSALDKPLKGDVLRREDSGGLFVCTDPEADAPRTRSFEVGPTGPMPGKKMVRPAGEVAAAEAAVLEALGLEEALFVRETGTRRPLRAPVRDWAAETHKDGCWLSFSLPAGAFATSVIREVARIG